MLMLTLAEQERQTERGSVLTVSRDRTAAALGLIKTKNVLQKRDETVTVKNQADVTEVNKKSNYYNLTKIKSQCRQKTMMETSKERRSGRFHQMLELIR